MRPQPSLCGIALDLEPVPDLEALETDPDRVEQILVNLIENAAQASAPRTWAISGARVAT